jgi:hypothetical protein
VAEALALRVIADRLEHGKKAVLNGSFGAPGGP